MKKTYKELADKSVQDLKKEVLALKGEIMKIIMESASNPQKDTNLVSKKRRRLAMIMTAMNNANNKEVSNKSKI